MGGWVEQRVKYKPMRVAKNYWILWILWDFIRLNFITIGYTKDLKGSLVELFYDDKLWLWMKILYEWIFYEWIYYTDLFYDIQMSILFSDGILIG